MELFLHAEAWIALLTLTFLEIVLGIDTIGENEFSIRDLILLALAFLILIGFTLAMEAFHKEIPKRYVYVAVLFSFTVELINLRVRRKTEQHKRKEH